jgi:hypothetical protein
MSDARSAQTWRLAAKQHGILARGQLLALGFSAAAIEHRIARGRLHPVARGVYAVGWPHLDRRRRWAAAVLAAGCGDRTARSLSLPYFGHSAALSHRSAAAVWGIGKELPGRIDLTVRRRDAPRRPGLRVRGRPSLATAEIRLFDDLPVTSPVRTLIDLTTELDVVAVERAVNDADKRDLIDPESLRLALDGHAGEPGVRPLRQLLDRLTFRLSDSELEIHFRPIATSAGLPSPLSKQLVNGFEVDFFWPDLGLVVETDGLRYHRTASAQKRDALRDRTHILAGMTPLRFTHYEVRHEPRRVRSDLSRAAAMLQRRIRR